MTWAADGPVPMMATRFPLRFASVGQSAVCQLSPLNVEAPGIAGSFARLKSPVAWTTTFAVHLDVCFVFLCSEVTVHNIVSSDHSAWMTFSLNLVLFKSPYLLANPS